MEFNEADCEQVLLAMNFLQASDMLSNAQLEIAIRIMDKYPDLNEQFVYLRDRYDQQLWEKSVRRDSPG